MTTGNLHVIAAAYEVVGYIVYRKVIKSSLKCSLKRKKKILGQPDKRLYADYVTKAALKFGSSFMTLHFIGIENGNAITNRDL